MDKNTGEDTTFDCLLIYTSPSVGLPYACEHGYARKEKGHTHIHCKRMAPSFLDADDKNIFAEHEQLPRNWKESKFGFHNFQATQRTGTGAKAGRRNEETANTSGLEWQ